MIWTTVGTIQISRQWSYTPVTEGEVFRFKHSGVPGGNSFFYLAQASIFDETTYLLDITKHDVVSEEQLLTLPKPEVFKDRILAFRRGYPPTPFADEMRNTISPTFLQKQTQTRRPLQPLNWTITVEAGDFTGGRFIDAGTY